MTDYIDFRDLKSLLLGIIGGLIVLGIVRYWSSRHIKSMRRRIEENEAYKANLNNLAKSDKALLISGFQGVFVVIAVICIIVALENLLLFAQMELISSLIYVVIWLFPVVLCFGLIKTLQDIRDHPKSLERIDTKITKLKKKLLGRPH